MDNYDNLTNEELCLEYQKTNNEDIYNYFVNRNKSLIYRCLFRYSKNPNKDIEIVQIGLLAVWRAMKSFKLEKHARFFTYYPYVLLKEFREFKHSDNPDITIPYRAIGKLDQAETDHPLNVYRMTSLDTPISYNNEDQECTLLEAIPDESINVELSLLETEKRKEILDLIYTLPIKERDIVIKYFGFDGKGTKTFEEIGKEYGQSRQAINQKLNKALLRLSKKIKAFI